MFDRFLECFFYDHQKSSILLIFFFLCIGASKTIKKATATSQSNLTDEPVLSQSKQSKESMLQSYSTCLSRDVGVSQLDQICLLVDKTKKQITDFEVDKTNSTKLSRDSQFAQSGSSQMSQSFQSDLSDDEKEEDIALLPSLAQRLANIRLCSSDNNKGNSQSCTREIPIKTVVLSSEENDKDDERKQGINAVIKHQSSLDYRNFSSSKLLPKEGEHRFPVYDKRQQDDRVRDTFNEKEHRFPVYHKTKPDDHTKENINEKNPVCDTRKLESVSTEIRFNNHTGNNQEALLDQQRKNISKNGTSGKEYEVFHLSSSGVKSDNKDLTSSSSIPRSSKEIENIYYRSSSSDFSSVDKDLASSSTPCFTEKKKRVLEASRKSFIDDLLFSGDDDDSLLGALDELENKPLNEGECVKSTPSHNFELSHNIENDSLLGDNIQKNNGGECIKSTPSPVHLTHDADDDSLLDVLVELREHNGEECRHETPSPPCCINLSTPNVLENEQPVLKEVSKNFSQLGDSILDDGDEGLFQKTPSLGNHRKQAGFQGDDKENDAPSVTVADFEKSLRRKLNLTTPVEHNTKNKDAECDIAHVYETVSPLVSSTPVPLSPLCLADRLKARFRNAR